MGGNEQEIINRLISKFMNTLNEYGYPEGSIIQNVNIRKLGYTLDIAIIELITSMVSAVIEVKIFKGNFIDGDNELQELKRNTGNELFRIQKNAIPDARFFALIIDENEGYKIYEYKFFGTDDLPQRITTEIQKFPSYAEISGARRSKAITEKKVEINNNYKIFQKVCWIICTILILLFIMNINKCEYLPLFGNYIKVCDYKIDYVDLIILGGSFIIFALSLLTKIKTIWFELDWTKNNDKV